MPWWQSPFSSSSSSSSSKSSSSGGTFSWRRDRQVMQGKKLRNLTDNDGEVTSACRPSFSHAAPPSPQPLPLPELQVLLRNHVNSSPSNNANNVPLPSPKDVIGAYFERERAREREIRADALNGGADANGGVGNGVGRLSTQEARRSTDHSETRPAWRPNRDMNGTDRTPDNFFYNSVPLSAPTSPYSSATRLGQHIGTPGDISTNQYVTPPACFHVWSAPEMPSADTTLSLGSFSNQMLAERTAYSVDHSPLQSPRISTSRNILSASGSISPLPNKMPAESSATRRESSANSQANVHPLPLPPGAATSQPAPVPHLASVPEVVPVNSQWQKGKLIGRGTFGSVYVASNRETGALCAMKEVELLADDPKSAESIKQLEQEIKVLSNLKHPNIVQYYGSEIVGDRFYIYLEYVHPGSLTKFIKDHCGAMTESVVRNFTRHILSGLAYLHSTKTIHRDIKGANLLVDAYGVVKLADFGMAKHLNEHRANLSLKGSPYWMAPELLQSVIETDATVDVALAIDIWSLGCTIIEMLSGRPPWSEYEGPAAMFKVLKENPPLPENLSEEARDFLECCFRRNPAERPTASMLLEHRFVKGGHQPDVPSSSAAKSGENVRSQKERPSIKFDQVPVILEAQLMRGRVMTDNENGQPCNGEAFNLRAVPHHSPRSPLEARPGLSLLRSSGYSMNHSSTLEN